MVRSRSGSMTLQVNDDRSLVFVTNDPNSDRHRLPADATGHSGVSSVFDAETIQQVPHGRFGPTRGGGEAL